MAFVHLHVHTEHSLLDGMIRVEEYYAHLAALGQTAGAVTDHGSLSGLWKAQQAAEKAGVKPIMGVEAYLAIGDRHNTGDPTKATPRQRGFIEVEREDNATDEGSDHSGVGAAPESGDLLQARLYASWRPATRHTGLGLRDTALELLKHPSDQLREAGVAEQLRGALESAPEPARGGTWSSRLAADAAALAEHIRATLPETVVQRVVHALRPMKRRYYEHLVLLAMNDAGWRNLLALQNAAEHPASRFQGKPRIDLQLLRDHTEGLICLTGCLGGPILGPLSRGQRAIAERNLTELVDLFGRENVFVELMEHGIAEESRIVPDAVQLARDHGVGIVATNDAHYLTDGHADAHAAWLAHQSKSTVANPKYAFHGSGFHLASETEMRAKRPEPWWQQACDNTQLIADRVQGRVLPEPAIRLPEFQRPDGFESNLHYYYHLVKAGAEAKFGAPLPQDVRDRLNEETAVIQQMGMIDYFLIVEDMISWARSQGILVGHGRGCLHGDTLVHTSRGRLPIRRVRIGDLVRTHRGRQRTVTARMQWETAPGEGLVVVHTETSHGHLRTLSLTEDHLVWAARQDPALPRKLWQWSWVAAKDLTFDHVLELSLDETNDLSTRLQQSRVVGIGRVPAPATVYDLTVADDESFLTSGGVVHNSAAGSLVSYCLGIHSVDPLRHDLLFERFLEPGREGMPDIDTDFERDRRDEVFAYLAEKYGHDHVARIGTLGFARTKEAIKAAAKVLDLPGSLAESLTKEVPIVGGKPMTFATLADPAVGEAEPFRNAMHSRGEDARQVVALASEFENIITKLGVHACGFLISSEPIAQLVPLRYDKLATAADQNQEVFTAWDGVDVEQLGMCKIDILGLTNLNIVSSALSHIHDGDELTLETIPDPDDCADPRVARTWELLQQGHTSGVFQLESSGIRELTEGVRPENWNDLSAILALYRPGPMAAGFHELYADRKHGRKPVDYSIFTPDPAEQAWIRTVLDDTFGLVVYQEQAMRLGGVIAGFGAKQRSRLRKAMGKKIRALMDELKVEFLEGAVREFRNGSGEVVSPVFRSATAERVWDYLEGNSEYLFNKSHSQAYARLTFDTAFLKANWPAAFGAGILATQSSSERRVSAIQSLATEGVEVLPPDINHSQVTSVPEGDRAVRLGLAEVKGVKGNAEILVSNRLHRYGGTFTELWQPVLATDGGEPGGPKVAISAIEALIEAGAMDCFSPHRLGMMTVVRAQSADVSANIPALEWGGMERARRQRRATLTSFGVHPLDRYRELVEAWRPEGAYNTEVLFQEGLYEVSTVPAQSGSLVKLRAMVALWNERTYRGGKMVELILEDASGATIRGTIWNDVYERLGQSGPMPHEGSVVFVRARVRTRIQEWEVVGEDGEAVTERIESSELTVSEIVPILLPDDSRRVFPPAMVPRIRFGELDSDSPGPGTESAASPDRSDATEPAPLLGTDRDAREEPAPTPVPPEAAETVEGQAPEVAILLAASQTAQRARVLLELDPTQERPGEWRKQVREGFSAAWRELNARRYRHETVPELWPLRLPSGDVVAMLRTC